MFSAPALFLMTTIQDRIAEKALRVLDSIGGVWITLLPDNITVRANVDRVNKPVTKAFSEVPVEGEQGISFFIQKRLLNAAPRLEMIVRESDGRKHRIGDIKDLGQRWQLLCEEALP